MAVKQKLCSRRGATLMAALLFFLVAAVCGSIILAAATATLSRVKNQARDARAYYAVTSAAQLIRDDLMDSKWELTITEEYMNGSSAPTTTINNINVQEPAQTFVQDLKASTFANNIPVASDDIVITTSISELPAVYAKVTNTADMALNNSNDVLNMEITLTNDRSNNRFSPAGYRESDNNGNQLYWVSVELRSMRVPELDSVISDSTDSNGKRTVERKIGLTWGDPVIKKVER